MFAVKSSFWKALLVVSVFACCCWWRVPLPPQGSQARRNRPQRQPLAVSSSFPQRQHPGPGHLEPVHPRHLHPAGDEPEPDGAPLHVEL